MKKKKDAWHGCVCTSGPTNLPPMLCCFFSWLCILMLLPGGEIPGAEEEVQADGSGERSQTCEDGRGGSETSQPGQSCCCCCSTVGCERRSDPLPPAGRGHVMCCGGKTGRKQKQSVRGAAGATQRCPQRRRRRRRLLFVLRHTFIGQQGRVCAGLCVSGGSGSSGVKRCSLRQGACKLAAAPGTQRVKGLTGLHKVGKAVQSQRIEALFPHLKTQCGFNAP